ncbi:mechanosensitive ion channel family protein [Alphaproteobacteria bacterium]|nr:mechanosensitive ion channel family protein [Alphaproteobacteria bacterium]
MDFSMEGISLSQILSKPELTMFVTYFSGFFAGIGTLIIGFWLSGRAERAVRHMLDSIPRLSPMLIPICSSVTRYAGIIITLVVSLGQFGIQTTSIIAVLGAAGLAIGLALQGTLSNVAAGVMLLILRPFETGDWIEVAGSSGVVKEVGLFTTSIDTFDNIFISMPNSTIWSSTIINHSRHTQRRLDIEIGVSYNSDLDNVEKTMLSLTDDPRIHQNPEPQFHVLSYADSSILVRLRVYVDYDDMYALNWDLNKRIKKLFDSHNIEIPFAQLVLHNAD